MSQRLTHSLMECVLTFSSGVLPIPLFKNSLTSRGTTPNGLYDLVGIFALLKESNQ